MSVRLVAGLLALIGLGAGTPDGARSPFELPQLSEPVTLRFDVVKQWLHPPREMNRLFGRPPETRMVPPPGGPFRVVVSVHGPRLFAQSEEPRDAWRFLYNGRDSYSETTTGGDRHLRIDARFSSHRLDLLPYPAAGWPQVPVFEPAEDPTWSGAEFMVRGRGIGAPTQARDGGFPGLEGTAEGTLVDGIPLLRRITLESSPGTRFLEWEFTDHRRFQDTWIAEVSTLTLYRTSRSEPEPVGAIQWTFSLVEAEPAPAAAELDPNTWLHDAGETVTAIGVTDYRQSPPIRATASGTEESIEQLLARAGTPVPTQRALPRGPIAGFLIGWVLALLAAGFWLLARTRRRAEA